jgi:hypothetical protein
LIKLGILIYPQISYANLLDKYLADRKKEILNEINQAYFGRGQDQPGTCLYL